MTPDRNDSDFPLVIYALLVIIYVVITTPNVNRYTLSICKVVVYASKCLYRLCLDDSPVTFK